MSNHNIYSRAKTVLAAIGLATFMVAVIGFANFMHDMVAPNRMTMDYGSAPQPREDFKSPLGKGDVVWAVHRDHCSNSYGPLFEQVASDGLTVTVPRGSNVWAELEATVFDAQVGIDNPRDFNDWSGWKAETRPERERIVGNLLVALRNQEKDSLTVVPAGYKVHLEALNPAHRGGEQPPRNNGETHSAPNID